MNLDRAIEIAVAAHKGHVDKGGNPYILHPLSVMMSLDSEEERISGVLHDVVEDSEEWSFEKLRLEGFSIPVIEALKSVTKLSDDEDYDVFITRCLSNPIGRRVKIADIQHNLDVTRIGVIEERDMDRLNKYKKALIRLRE